MCWAGQGSERLSCSESTALCLGELGKRRAGRANDATGPSAASLGGAGWLSCFEGVNGLVTAGITQDYATP